MTSSAVIDSSGPHMRKPLHHRLHVQMGIGFAAGALFGLAARWVPTTHSASLHWLIDNITQPLGQLFLRLLLMLVLPLIFCAIVLGVAEMRNLAKLGRVGVQVAALTIGGCASALGIGLLLVNVIGPGRNIDPRVAGSLLSSSAGAARVFLGQGAPTGGTLDLVPANVVRAASDGHLLPIMLFSMLLGIGVILTPRSRSASFEATLSGLLAALMALIDLIIKAAPLAVFCLMFDLAAQFGWAFLISLADYMAVVLAALAAQMFIVYSAALRLLGRASPIRFFRDAQDALLVAFSTASSSASLPTTLAVAEEKLKLPRETSRFVVTIGAATNHHGTALFEGVTVLFLAQVFGIHLGLIQQLTVMAMCILASVGTASVPAGALPVIVAILVQYHIPPESIGLVVGVDRLLDMCRTATNVAGDLAVATIVSRSERTGEGAAGR